MALKTFDEARRVLATLRESEPMKWLEFRQICSADLQRDWPEGEGLGSSDVSCHMIEVARYADIDRVLEEGEVYA